MKPRVRVRVAANYECDNAKIADGSKGRKYHTYDG